MERDDDIYHLKLAINEFQLTRSRGARHESLRIKTKPLRFQLTRSRGARHVLDAKRMVQSHFNSRAHVERDVIGLFLMTQEFNFNSRAHVERDFDNRFFKPSCMYFNSRAHVERDGFECGYHNI